MRRITLLTATLVITLLAGPGAQHRLVPVAALGGEPALELMLRKLDTVGSFMMTTAHPDDENNAMLAYMSHGKGFRTTLVTATRGEGGQNEIGPELFEALAVLRTEELLAAHRFDGAEQFFTRAIDFGYTKTPAETLSIWDRDAVLADVVWTTVYTTDIREFKQIVAAREEFFKDNLPTSTMVEVAHLADPGLMVEITVIAAIT